MSLNKRIKNIYIAMELVLPMYNAHLYLKFGQKVSIIHGKRGKCDGVSGPQRVRSTQQLIHFSLIQ